MKQKVIEWIKRNKHFVVFAETGRVSGDMVKDTKEYSFQMSIEHLIKVDDTRNVFMDYYPEKGIVEISLQSYALSSKPNIEFTTTDKELIGVLENNLLPYKQHTFNIIDNGFLVKIDDEEEFREVDGIDGLKKDLLDEASEEAIPEINRFMLELQEKIKNKKSFYIKSTLRLKYINEYMLVEIIALNT